MRSDPPTLFVSDAVHLNDFRYRSKRFQALNLQNGSNANVWGGVTLRRSADEQRATDSVHRQRHSFICSVSRVEGFRPVRTASETLSSADQGCGVSTSVHRQWHPLV